MLARTAIQGGAFAVTARTETDGALSNWVTTATGVAPGHGGLVQNLNADIYENGCASVKTSPSATVFVANGACIASENSTDLRYNYVY